jgi:hypothetical protein
MVVSTPLLQQSEVNWQLSRTSAHAWHEPRLHAWPAAQAV